MKTINRYFKNVLALGLGIVWIMRILPAHADITQIKAYKEVFPEAKPKCIECHVDAMPKKADGQHDPNDYGKAVVAAAEKDAKPTAETYKKVGAIENFKK